MAAGGPDWSEKLLKSGDGIFAVYCVSGSLSVELTFVVVLAFEPIFSRRLTRAGRGSEEVTTVRQEGRKVFSAEGKRRCCRLRSFSVQWNPSSAQLISVQPSSAQLI